MVTEDWLMRQVDAMARSIALLVFHKDDTAYVPSGDESADGLHEELMARLAVGDLGGAEDLLYVLRRYLQTQRRYEGDRFRR